MFSLCVLQEIKVKNLQRDIQKPSTSIYCVISKEGGEVGELHCHFCWRSGLYGPHWLCSLSVCIDAIVIYSLNVSYPKELKYYCKFWKQRVDVHCFFVFSAFKSLHCFYEFFIYIVRFSLLMFWIICCWIWY